jgi:ubiquinone biosynthesis protein
LPRDLGDVLKRVLEGTFSVHLDLRHIDPVINRLVLGLMTAALLVSSALLWNMKAPPTIAGVSVFGGAGYLNRGLSRLAPAACHQELGRH